MSDIERRIDEAEAIYGDVPRAQAFQALLPVVDELRRRVIAGRQEAVLEANRSGTAFPDLAEALDVSKSLIQKLVREAREAEAAAKGNPPPADEENVSG